MTIAHTDSSPPQPSADSEIAGPSQDLNDDLRAMRALRLLLESRMIDRTEYERRLASFKRRLELGAITRLETDAASE